MKTWKKDKKKKRDLKRVWNPSNSQPSKKRANTAMETKQLRLCRSLRQNCEIAKNQPRKCLTVNTIPPNPTKSHHKIFPPFKAAVVVARAFDFSPLPQFARLPAWENSRGRGANRFLYDRSWYVIGYAIYIKYSYSLLLNAFQIVWRRSR
jgi:hypothetical protein